MDEPREQDGRDEVAGQADSRTSPASTDVRTSYAQLGLNIGAPMHEIETAYWQFARDLRGQAAMAPYTKAYEVLVNNANPATETESAPPSPAATRPKITPRPSSPGSKFGWPAS